MPRVLRSLHIGVGNRGAWPLEFGTPANGYLPTALCDLSADFLAGGRQITGLPESACYANVEAALRHPGIECVIICTPTNFHVPFAKLAISRGLPVLMEKGMAPDYATALDLLSAVRAAGVPVCVAQNYRYRAIERTIAACVTQSDFPGFVGPVHMMDYFEHRVRPLPRTLTYPFASVWDMSCHHFDNLLAWFGPAESMVARSCRAAWSAYEHDNNTFALIRFANGATVNYAHTHDAARSHGATSLHGQRGAVWVDQGKVFFSERPLENFGSRPAQEVPMCDGPDALGVLRDFHRYVTEGVEPGISARNNMEVMAMCHMMVRSITEGRAIKRSEIDG